MKITEVIVSAGRVVSHPTENYANLRPQVTVKAALDDGDDFEQITKDLQAKAERLVEDHKNNLVENILTIERLKHEDAEMADLETKIQKSQRRLEDLRANRGTPKQLTTDEPEPWEAH